MKRSVKKYVIGKRLIIVASLGLLIVGALFGWNAMRIQTSVVPRSIQRSVDFSVYYPASVPPGYTLETESFQLAEAEVVLFKVTDSQGRDIIFSEQRQPSAADIDKFISSYLPLNSVMQLPLGQAKAGAYGSAPNIRTVLSLPIRSGPWLIVTAPSDISHDDLVALLTSLTK